MDFAVTSSVDLASKEAKTEASGEGGFAAPWVRGYLVGVMRIAYSVECRFPFFCAFMRSGVSLPFNAI
jgi:hypothetical protein